MSQPPFVKSFISLFAKGVVNRFIPKETVKGIFWILFSLVLFLFFLGFLSMGLFDLLKLYEFASWSASLILAALYLISLIVVLCLAKRALSPKKISEEITMVKPSDVVGAFLDGLFDKR